MPTVNKGRSDADVVALQAFIRRKRRKPRCERIGVSLFSGCGISDYGYELAGFRFAVQVEANETRGQIGEENFSHSKWIIDEVASVTQEVASTVRMQCDRPWLLAATPPCQGMSSSNPSRGKRDSNNSKKHEAKNRLLLDVVPIVNELRPRVVVAENVRQILTHCAGNKGRKQTIVDTLRDELAEYEVFAGVVNVADYGIPQDRRRAVIVAIQKDEPWLSAMKRRNRVPWPKPTHAESGCNGHRLWATVGEWLRLQEYEKLDSSAPVKATGESHDLHFVPHYDARRYSLVSSIPANSGATAYESDRCMECGRRRIPTRLANCPYCRRPMWNRPIVLSKNGRGRLIKGFHTSYRRMRPDRPAPTVTTNSSHVGSDIKIHPWENRVLSILECADLQTVPRSFNWSPAFDRGHHYLVRNLIGESFPSYFTFLHGRVLLKLMEGRGGYNLLAAH